MTIILDNHCLEAIRFEICRRQLPDDFINMAERWYAPLAEYLTRLQRHKKDTLLVSLNGPQGSGKSTLTAFVRLLLKQHFHLNTVEVSIDDFYLTRKERHELASTVHPLLQTRGVPGTHDIELAQQTLSCLKHCSNDNPCRIPVFDKSIDDRAQQSIWPRVQQSVDIILFEGWCNHAPVQSVEELDQAVNELEKLEDKYGIWRQYVNDRLLEYHQRLFDQADVLVFLKIPNFKKVYEWRGLQEQKLESGKSPTASAVMNTDQLKRFIQHYERITRQCRLHLPATADVVLTINERHQIESMQIKGQQAE